MSLLWLNTAAFAGLALLALPLAIHLLVRQHTRTLAYPSLRFVRQTALSAFRRRAIEDALLLVCRIAILVAAVAALAGPVLQTPGRSAAYGERVIRALVLVDGEAPPEDATRSAYRFASFARGDVADAIADALRWLHVQPKGSREIVFGGSLARGAIEDGDLVSIPKHVGIRFIRSPSPQRPREIAVPTLALRNGETVRIDQQIRVDADATTLSGATEAASVGNSVRVMASAKDQPFADVALRAALSAGVRWTTRSRQVVIVWEGAEAAPDARSGVELIRMPVPEPQSAASAIWTALDQAADPITEPLLISDEQLTAWTRAPGPPPLDSQPADEGDRRWLWGTAIGLLALEVWLRRRADQSTVESQEARVA